MVRYGRACHTVLFLLVLLLAPTAVPAQPTGASREVFIELSTDKDEVYVQEQLLLTIRLFFSRNLIIGELSEPQHPDAMIEPLGSQRTYSRERDGTRYRVVERRFAIFPQKPGEFRLPPVQFEGRIRDSRDRLQVLRDSARLFDIRVKPVPADFSGDSWLPASQLTLAASGLEGISGVKPGQNLTRTLSLHAIGLPAEALPPFANTTQAGLRRYPEKPVRESQIQEDGITSSLTQTLVLVPVAGGEQIIPAIRLPWWDTTTDTQQVATIPARSLEVTGATPEPPTKPQVATTHAGEPNAMADSGPSGQWFWLRAGLAVAGVVVLALFYGCWKQRSGSLSAGKKAMGAENHEKELFRALRKAARRGAVETLVLLPRWARRRFPGERFVTVAEVARFAQDPELTDSLEELQARLFAAPAAGPRARWRGARLAGALLRFRGGKKKGRQRPNGLPPLYPASLSPR